MSVYLDPYRGPRIPGWVKYDPRDPSTLAILGTSTTEALPGNHREADKSCAYWNTVLPQFPQVSFGPSLPPRIVELSRSFRPAATGRAERCFKLAGDGIPD